MSIINAITKGQGSSEQWNVVTKTSGTDTSLTFSVLHEPKAWLIFATDTLWVGSSGYMTCFICKYQGDYYEWKIRWDSSSTGTFLKGGTATGTFNNNTFTINASTAKFRAASGIAQYVLVYI